MNKTSFTPVFKKKLKAHGYGVISIRITKDRKSEYFSTGETIDEELWNKKQKEVRIFKGKITEEETKRINNVIKNKTIELEKLHELNNNNSDNLKLNDRQSFVRVLLDEIDQLQKNRKIGTSKRYKTAYYHLKDFLTTLNKSDLLFSEIDTLFVRDFETYLNTKSVRNKEQNIKKNSVKNYINCLKRLFNASVEARLFTSMNDPFIRFKNTRDKVEKKSLIKRDVEKIIAKEFQKDSVLFHTKNSFLFQIMSQGLRVSDLLTMRFNKINEGRFIFTQYKTKKPHPVLINDNMVLILKDYIHPDFTVLLKQEKLSVNKIFERRYSYPIGGITELLCYNDILKRFIQVRDDRIERKVEMAAVEEWNKYFTKVKRKVVDLLLIVICEYAKKFGDNFVFPYLDKEKFKGVNFNSDTSLTNYQYNQLQSKTTIYNKNLKKLQEECNISIKLTSHLSRHTYSNLMLEEGFDTYEISKSLGHTRLSTTESYLSDFNVEKVDKSNIEFSKSFTHLF